VATVVSPQLPVWMMASLQRGEGDGLWFGQVWAVGVEGAVKWSHSFGESLLFLVHGVDYIPSGDGSLLCVGGADTPRKKNLPL
jgi:hypothetical protein